MKDVVIASSVCTPVGRAFKGTLRATRPDELAAVAIKGALARVPQLDPKEIEDVILGCAMPEAASSASTSSASTDERAARSHALHGHAGFETGIRPAKPRAAETPAQAELGRGTFQDPGWGSNRATRQIYIVGRQNLMVADPDNCLI
jgi:hypothetical protein